ncbi:MAG: hypothetical protein ACYS6K_25075, partial [Planctomycetota bacterium]
MADRVIVVGTKRGRSSVPVSEIQQMCGRAGRSHFGLSGIANVIVEESRAVEVQQEMESAESLNVHSQISDIDNMSFHLTA